MNAIEQIKADYTLRRHEIINQGDFGQLIGVVRFAQAVHYFRTGEWVENYSILHHSFGGDRGLYGLIIETLCDLDGKEPPFTELTEKQIHAWHVHAGCDVTYARESQHFRFMDERLRAMRVPTSASDYFDNDEWFVSFHSELFDAVCDRIEREALANLQPAPAEVKDIEPVASKKRYKRTGWFDVAGEYVVGLYKANGPMSAKGLYRLLQEHASDADSPFKVKNQGLLLKQSGNTLTFKTLENKFKTIKHHAQK